MKDKQAACEVENGLCSGSLLTDNRPVFSNVYTLNRRSTSHFLQSIKHCALSKFREVAAWFQDHASHVQVAPILRELRDQLRVLRNELFDELRGLRSFFSRDEPAEVEDNADVIVRG